MYSGSQRSQTPLAPGPAAYACDTQMWLEPDDVEDASAQTGIIVSAADPRE